MHRYGDMPSSEEDKLRSELLGMKPFLTTRLQYIKENNMMLEFVDQVKQIQDFLDVIEDRKVSRLFGEHWLRQSLRDIQDMKCNFPTPLGRLQRERSPESSRGRKNFFGGNAYEGTEEWPRATAQDDEWGDSESPKVLYERRPGRNGRNDWLSERVGQLLGPRMQEDRGENTTKERKQPWYHEFYQPAPAAQPQQPYEQIKPEPYPTQPRSGTTFAAPPPYPIWSSGTQQKQYHRKHRSTSCGTVPSSPLLESGHKVNDAPSDFTRRSPSNIKNNHVRGTGAKVELVDLVDSSPQFPRSGSPSLLSTSFRNPGETSEERFRRRRRRAEQHQHSKVEAVVLVDLSDDEGQTTPVVKKLTPEIQQQQVVEAVVLVDLSDDEGQTTPVVKKMTPEIQQQQVVEAVVLVDLSDDEGQTTPVVKKMTPEIQQQQVVEAVVLVDLSDDEGQTTPVVKKMTSEIQQQQVVEMLVVDSSDDEEPTTSAGNKVQQEGQQQQPAPVPVDVNNLETQQQQPAPVPVDVNNLETQQQQPSPVPVVVNNLETQQQQPVPVPVVVNNLETQQQQPALVPVVVNNLETQQQQPASVAVDVNNLETQQQQPAPVPVVVNNLETQQQQPAPVPVVVNNLETQQQQLETYEQVYAETIVPVVDDAEAGSPEYTQQGRVNDPGPAQPAAKVEQVLDVDDASQLEEEFEGVTITVIKQDADEDGELAEDILFEEEYNITIVESEDEYEQVSQLLNPMEVYILENSPNELDNCDKPEGAAAATPGPSTDVECPVLSNRAGKEPETQASPRSETEAAPLNMGNEVAVAGTSKRGRRKTKVPTQSTSPPPEQPEPRSEAGAAKAAQPLIQENEPAVAGTSNRGRRKAKAPTPSEGSADQPATKKYGMTLRKRNSKGKTQPPQRKYLPKKNTEANKSKEDEDEIQDPQASAKMWAEAVEYYRPETSEIGLRIVDRHAIRINPFLYMIKLEAEEMPIVKVEAESAEVVGSE